MVVARNPSRAPWYCLEQVARATRSFSHGFIRSPFSGPLPKRYGQTAVSGYTAKLTACAVGMTGFSSFQNRFPTTTAATTATAMRPIHRGRRCFLRSRTASTTWISLISSITFVQLSSFIPSLLPVSDSAFAICLCGTAARGHGFPSSPAAAPAWSKSDSWFPD